MRRFHHKLIFFIACHNHAKLSWSLVHLEFLKLRWWSLLILLRISLTLDRWKVDGYLTWHRCMTHVSLMSFIHSNSVSCLTDHVFIVFLFHLSKDLSLVKVLGRFNRCSLGIFIFNVRRDQMACLIRSLSDHLLFFIIIIDILCIVRMQCWFIWIRTIN